MRSETREALAICANAGAALVVNDFWRVAIDVGAPWTHLGQEDLDTADLDAIRKAGVKLGVSTHDDNELSRALALDPDYVALGPIYPTASKPWLSRRKVSIGSASGNEGSAPIPLVAIGGLTVERGKLCLAAGADIVSVVTDITLNADPEARARAMGRGDAAGMTQHAHRARHRGLRFGRRRRNTGGPQDLCGARRLRRERGDRVDRAEHARRPRDPRRSA